MKLYVNNKIFTGGISTKIAEVNDFNMAFYTTDQHERVLKNREKLASTLGYQVEDFVCCQQTHSDRFVEVTHQHKGLGAFSDNNAIANCDALYTYEKGLVLCAFTADCVPVIITNETTGLCAVVHSGWKGTVKEITRKLLNHLIKDNNHPQHMNVYIGMALSQERFEVDRDVYEQFAALSYAMEAMYWREESQKYHIDNQVVVQKQCELAGIPLANIQLDNTCTYEAAEGFSYRQNKSCGRHLAFVVRK